MLPAMVNAEYLNVGGLDNVVDRVGKTSKQATTDVLINDWVELRVVLDSINARQKFINEFTPQAIVLLLVPLFCCRLEIFPRETA